MNTELAYISSPYSPDTTDIVTIMEHYLLVCGGREEEGLCRVGLDMASAVGRRPKVAIVTSEIQIIKTQVAQVAQF